MFKYFCMSFSEFTTKTVDELYAGCATRSDGLTMDEVLALRLKYGINEIAAREVGWWSIMARQFKSPFIYLLIFAALLAIFLGELTDGIIIIVFVVINTVIGFAQEYHSERSLTLLKKFVVAQARVRRAGKDELVGSSELVPGDIVMVETGDVVPADIRLCSTHALTVDESALTGESAPVTKTSEAATVNSVEIQSANNMVFSGSSVVSGQGVGVVVGTGRQTAMGRVTALTVETERESTFEKGIAKFSRFILRMIVVILVFLFLANLLIKGTANIAELLLFSIALAVSVIPEALPVVTTLSLSRGALQMARNKVVVKRLAAVEDLGSIEILCTDKTGTLTENALTVTRVLADDATYCVSRAMAAASFLSEKKREPNNAFDVALWATLSPADRSTVLAGKKLSEIPFDPARRRNSVCVGDSNQASIVVRGAPESVLPLCTGLPPAKQTELGDIIRAEGETGHRVIAIAEKKLAPHAEGCSLADENDLQFVGLIFFEDPIKNSAADAVRQAGLLGIVVKILTGDGPEVAGAVAHQVGLITDPHQVITGAILESKSIDEQHELVYRYHVFARVSPEQKYHIIKLLQEKNEVGFLGEGINDAPALKLANVAMVVEGASDIAREAADIVLLNKSLSVIIEGIEQGRAVFSNTVKYLKATLISNFGNFYAIAIVSLMITFLPMLPIQLLLLNLLSDFPMIAIALDTIDPGEFRRPRVYNVRGVVLIAIILGLVSTIFDFIYFAVFSQRSPDVLRTNWFIGSVLTELALIFSIRTRGFFLFAKRPAWLLIFLSGLGAVVAVAMPYMAMGSWLFHFIPPSTGDVVIIFGIALAYFIITETGKLLYYRFWSYD